MDRRAVLAAAGTLTAALAGCSTLDTESDAAPVHNVRVDNTTDEQHEVAVALVHDDEAVVDETRTVDAGRTWDLGTFETPGAYDLTVAAAGAERRESYELPLADEGRESFAVATVTSGPELDLMVYWQQ